MIDGLVKIVDRLIELVKYREEKSRRILDKLIEPIFTDLVLVHKDYLAMFEQVRTLLPRGGASRKKQQAKLLDAFEYLSKKRIEFEPTRIKLRAVSQSLAKRKKNKEDDFVLAVISYLWWTQRDVGSRSKATQLAEEIQAAVLRASYPPPGLRTEAQLLEQHMFFLSGRGLSGDLPNSEELDKYVGVILQELREKFAEVSEAYAEIFAKVRSE